MTKFVAKGSKSRPPSPNDVLFWVGGVKKPVLSSPEAAHGSIFLKVAAPLAPLRAPIGSPFGSQWAQKAITNDKKLGLKNTLEKYPKKVRKLRPSDPQKLSYRSRGVQIFTKSAGLEKSSEMAPKRRLNWYPNR